MTAQNIKKDAPEISVARTPEEVEKIRQRTIECAEKRKELLDITPTELADIAASYYLNRKKKTYRFGSPQELRRLFERHGFTVDECIGLSEKEMRDWGANITRESRERFWITATRNPPATEDRSVSPCKQPA